MYTTYSYRPFGKKGNLNTFFNELSREFLEETAKATSKPKVNIKENPDGFELQLALPGFTKKDISLKVEKGIITISSEIESKEDVKFTRREFALGAFKRSFKLPKTVDTEKISASMKAGILTVSLPKKEEAKEQPPRDINIG